MTQLQIDNMLRNCYNQYVAVIPSNRIPLSYQDWLVINKDSVLRNFSNII